MLLLITEGRPIVFLTGGFSSRDLDCQDLTQQLSPAPRRARPQPAVTHMPHSCLCAWPVSSRGSIACEESQGELGRPACHAGDDLGLEGWTRPRPEPAARILRSLATQTSAIAARAIGEIRSISCGQLFE